MSHTFAPASRPPLLSKNTSTSSTMQSKKDGALYSSQNIASMSKSVMHKASAYNYRPPSASSPHSLPEHGYRLQQPQTLSVQAYQNSNDQGDDSDYYHESTPGRAWKETKQAVPRMRVVGFNVPTPFTSEPGADVDPMPSYHSSLAPADEGSRSHTHSGTSRRASVSERSEIFYGQSLHAAADKPHVSRIHASAVPQRRPDTYRQQSISTGSDLRHKTITRAS